ncbi:hypothetical protein [Bradyrhizobium sp. JYMT SZCCT0180]|uniref:hypothetical protein n=1 Tax=Bradyrhizobium sp. JYMT SZCCT0180 TaxID=2807666 RepID=UPI001BAA2D15|nr:hypothetical protein [Bradyrhizobium sp. JYMT SZCCT0180]MBR1211248.1 hypothetical protein [Bradyrhizobium sp. JYMT SZCCT0180]
MTATTLAEAFKSSLRSAVRRQTEVDNAMVSLKTAIAASQHGNADNLVLVMGQIKHSDQRVAKALEKRRHPVCRGSTEPATVREHWVLAGKRSMYQPR